MMGALFRLIADEALEPLDEYYRECQVCRRTGVPLYEIDAIPDGETPGHTRYAACRDCLMSGTLAPRREAACSAVTWEHLRKYSAPADAANEAWLDARAAQLNLDHRRTPELAFPQDRYHDWPVCCGDLAEHIARPETQEEFDRHVTGAIIVEGNVRHGEAEEVDVEEFGDAPGNMYVFRCQQCGVRYVSYWYT